jgi:dTDP-glucose pyrophosphorylase
MTEVQEHLQKLELPVPFYLLVKSTPSSMHSFHELSHYLDSDNICLTTVDTIFKEDEFSGYIQEFLKESRLDGLMAVTDFIDDEKPLYVDTDNDLMIRGFLDKQGEPACTYISGGIYCLRRSGLTVLNNAIEQGMSRMRNYQRQLIAEGLRLKAYPFSKIVDVDHAEDIKKAEEFLKD